MILAAGMSTAAAPDGEARVLLTDEEGDMLHVQGFFASDTAEGTLSYRLDVERDGAGGTSQSAQGGTFETAPSAADTLSSTRVNVSDGDHLRITLRIDADDTTVAADTVDGTYPAILSDSSQ